MADRDIVKNLDDDLETTSEHARDGAPLSSVNGRRALAPSILIVERDELLRWAVYETLRESGYRLLPVRDEAHAKELIDRLPERFAAAVIDDDAWPLTGAGEAWLRERWPGLPILVLADEACPELTHRVRQMGVADLMVKPFEIQELRNRVARLVRLGRRAAAHRKSGPTGAAAAA